MLKANVKLSTNTLKCKILTTITMTSNDRVKYTSDMSSDSIENTCVVCFKSVEIYSIGICDHPVCYECSTRMRVCLQRMECPICRQEMEKVFAIIYTWSSSYFHNFDLLRWYSSKRLNCIVNLKLPHIPWIRCPKYALRVILFKTCSNSCSFTAVVNVH